MPKLTCTPLNSWRVLVVDGTELWISFLSQSAHSINVYAKVSAHTPYNWNIMCKKCEGDCGLWVPNEIIFKKYAESLKKIVGAVWELPAK